MMIRCNINLIKKGYLKMISMLLMHVFADPALAFRDGPNAKTTEWSWSRPDIDTPGVDARKFDAAAVTNKGDAAKAYEYIAALEQARNAESITEVTTIGKNQFTISAFTKKAGLALVKFYKNVADGTKNLLACVIDIASTGKKDADVTKADDIKGSWLKHFYEMIFGADKISEAKNTTVYTAVDDFVSNSGLAMTQAFTDLKGLVPREDGLLDSEVQEALKVVQEDKRNRQSATAYVGKATERQKKLVSQVREPEKYRLVLPLIMLQKAGIDVSNIVSRFSKKVWDLVEDLDIKTSGTRKKFEDDSAPSQLQLDVWKVWEDTVLQLGSKKTTEEREALVNASLAALDSIADGYKTS